MADDRADRGADGPAASGNALAEALRTEGLHVAVEARDRQAILIPEGAADSSLQLLQDADRRRRVVELARGHGFSHVGLELPGSAEPPSSESPNRATGASLSGDQSA